MRRRRNTGKGKHKAQTDAKASHGACTVQNAADAHCVLYESFLESFDSGLAIVDVDGTIEYANGKFAEMLRGNRFGPMAGSNLCNCFEVSDWHAIQNASKAASAGVINGKVQLVESGAPARSMVVSFYPITNGMRDKIAITIRENTQQESTAKALEESEMRRHDLGVQLLQAQDQERRRLAGDLHDIIGQELAVAIMTLDAAGRELERGGERAKDALRQAGDSLRKVESEVRTMSYVLHPPLLDQIGLEAALEWFREGFVKRTGIEVEIRVHGDLPRLRTDQETALFRVAQEALTNVYRHSGSRRAWVELSSKDSYISLYVKDEGKGFEPGTRLTGVGIQSMRGRMELFGGGLEVERHGKRTEVLATMPVTEANRHEGVLDLEKVSLDEHKTAPRASKARRILIVDDHDITREGIKVLLAHESDLEVCGEAANGLEAVEKVLDLAPDLVIMDLSMPVMGGLTAANRIRRSGLDTKVLVLTTHSYGNLARTARASGCDGFMNKGNASADLVRAVRMLLSGGMYYPEPSDAASAG